MTARLAGKIALITGSSSGIGRATVEAFLENGARVLAVDVNEPKDGAGYPRSDDIEFVKGSVIDQQTWTRAFSTAKANWGAHPNVLVNNAGVARSTPLIDITPEELDLVLGINLRAPLQGMQLFIKTLLAEKRTGSIVNVASVAGLRAFPGLGTYGLSKAAIAQLTRTAATEYGPSGIRVNAIAPGATHTAMTKGTVDQRDAPLLAHTSLKRWAEPKEMASSIVYLASDEASYVTGHVLVNDGGLVIN
ncbi:3-oxoacyl-[acyl-carrier-protein] reductase FabG [Vanrija pseudolonga]|uniref:3-oxoacyl-[acyl-carrier-protein] reductase FabG n=1 Tax=Vanrija pseudolonga TaxID=143232 RepID=A0AAF1BHL3_9TREE|nr:3-oxoacyl-[acyl-carrier-protein] reductase FabG [Vanrija pseudolonga]